MGEQRCSNCRHFLQHYALIENKIIRIYCGHCTLNRAKRKRPDASACKDFDEGVSQEATFASKEYLSKELLQYVLNLELLPEIQDGE